MKIHLRLIFMTTAVWSGLGFHSFAADGMVNLVKPTVAPLAVEARKDARGGLGCEAGKELQKNGYCCPKGTNDNLWPDVCTPNGTINDQIFNFKDITYYCPSPDMFIVSNKNGEWFSCADSSSTVSYAGAKQSGGSRFCEEHGYGYLIKIKPWGTVGCVKIGDSQGDGCIDAKTCSFGEK